MRIRPLDQVAATGGPVRLYLDAQGSHLSTSPKRIADYSAALSLLLAAGRAGVQAATESRFACGDANFGAAGPGVRINTVRFPDFGYEPYQTDLEAGLTPAASLEFHPTEPTSCS
jgi:hypothetical protein